jgi:hypothetical protein
LFGTNGLVVDYVVYGFQIADLSIGRSGSVWRLLAAPSPGAANAAPAALGNASSLRLNEWATGGTVANDWFELFNTSTLPVELSGLYLTDDPALTGLRKFQVAGLSFVGGLGFAQFEADGDPGQGRNHVNFHIDGGGEALRLFDSGLTPIDAVDFGRLTPGASMGRLPDGADTVVSFTTTPTPGSSNYRPLANAVINEVLAAAVDPLEGAVEIYNPTGTGVDVSGWFLSDTAANAKKYRLPNGTFLGGGGYLVIYQYQFGAPGPNAFTLEPAGGQVLLSEADAAGTLSGGRALAQYGAAPSGVSLGRVEGCFGSDFAALTARTFGQDSPASVAQFRTGAGDCNADAAVGPVVINEIMYHPPGAGTNDNTLDEFIELYNPTGAAVPLFDPGSPANVWKIAGGVEFALPSGLSLPAGGAALLVNFNPVTNPSQLATFRALFSVSTLVPILGPYHGKLGNSGETLELLRPLEPLANGLVPYMVADRVAYGASAPWPIEADGLGSSLQRRSALAYGNDAANWVAAAPTAAQPTTASPAQAPTIITQPLGRTVVPGGRVVFCASVCGTRPLIYQWKHDGNDIPGATGPSLVLPSVTGADAGTYIVRISNGGGTVLSVPAVLALGSPPVITTQPQSQSVGGGNPVTFTVAANSATPLSYQWRRNGQALAGATNATLVLDTLRAGDAGGYSVLVINAAGAVPSAVATLVVLIPPNITLQPQNQSVTNGSPVTFTVAGTGVGTLRYQWQFNGSNLPGATSATLNIPTAQLANEGDYRVLVTDDVASAQSQSAHLTVRVPPGFLIPPRGQTNVVGSTMTFSCVVTGSVPLSVRWLRISTGIATNIITSPGPNLTMTNTFTMTNVQTSTSGTYRVVLTNSGNQSGTIFAQFTVLVVAPPVITNQPLSQAADAGSTVTLTAGVSGTAPLGYQWRLGGVDLPGATDVSLVLTNLQAANQGSYQLVVSNFAGMATSLVARVTLTGTPVLQGPERMDGGWIRVGLSGTPNRSYAIDAAGDLVHWAELTTIQYTNGVMYYLDPPPAALTNRFYRARLVP